ncbi:hypothetical protein [Planctomicrobium sp. SH527]|uniref:hypothetical protein n=1 Tax=Planctomicrobium sp. SH527 TaxID=3448123 RepID=UPI003F5AFFFB
MSDFSHKFSPSRRHVLKSLAGGLATIAVLTSGCQQIWRRKKSTTQTAGESCSHEKFNGTEIPRRFFVASRNGDRGRGPGMQSGGSMEMSAPLNFGVTGSPNPFLVEVLAAFNSRPNCNAIPIPPHVLYQFDGEGTEGAVMSLQTHPDRFDPNPSFEEVLVIDVVEVQPYRPMRLSAIVERRNVADGSLISRKHQTWNAPKDDEPQGPNPLNRILLNHPPPLHEVEDKELGRLSPIAFYRNVAKELVDGVLASPYGIPAGTVVEEVERH